MSSSTLFDTNPASGSRFAADVPDYDSMSGLSELSDMDGNDLNVGMMVKAPEVSGWCEIIAILTEKRAVEVETHDGVRYAVLASRVTVL